MSTYRNGPIDPYRHSPVHVGMGSEAEVGSCFKEIIIRVHLLHEEHINTMMQSLLLNVLMFALQALHIECVDAETVRSVTSILTGRRSGRHQVLGTKPRLLEVLLPRHSAIRDRR